jgi:hypothetical protein
MDKTPGAPEAEVLKPRTDDGALPASEMPSTSLPANSDEGKKLRRRTYRPSHKATFIALGVVVAILAVNAVVLGFVLKNKSKNDKAASGQVTISADVLNKIGVNKSAIGNSGVKLTVDPDAQFNGKLNTAGDVTIGGKLKLNSKFTADDAALAQLEAGNASFSKLNVSGDSTLSALNLRNNLAVAGTAQIQGAVTIAGLLTLANNLNVVGNLAVGGTITTAGFTARNLASTGTLTIGGHIITSGSIPNFGAGSAALGSNGTASINGNDSAGTINIATGVGAASGLIGNIAFRTQYDSIPRIVITGVGTGATFYVVNPTIGGFSIYVNSALPAGGYAVNYIVEQ